MNTFQELQEEFGALLGRITRETGSSVEASAGEFSKIAVVLSKILAKSIGKPGYSVALASSVDVLALEAGIQATQEGDALDGRLKEILETALRFASRAIALI